jgi:hypothetical protein
VEEGEDVRRVLAYQRQVIALVEVAEVRRAAVVVEAAVVEDAEGADVVVGDAEVEDAGGSSLFVSI